MIKATVLYGHPDDANTFETYYTQTHIPLVTKASGIIKTEYTKFLPDPTGVTTPYYRMAELYFPTSEQMQRTMASPEGKAMAADLANFATGGATVMIGIVES